MKTLSVEQAVALLAFAARFGRSWKAELRTVWATCGYDRAGIGPDEAAPLQQVRNAHGPSWLARVTMAQIQSATACTHGVPRRLPPYHEQIPCSRCIAKTDTRLFEKVTSDEAADLTEQATDSIASAKVEATTSPTTRKATWKWTRSNEAYLTTKGESSTNPRARVYTCAARPKESKFIWTTYVHGQAVAVSCDTKTAMYLGRAFSEIA